MIAAPFEKTYLSRAQSRIWSMDNPVGDPFGGPAYGEKNEPVSMIAAVVAIGVGASTVAAATTLTLAAVMGGLMIAGGAASLIGTVSGNKKLAMIGGIVAGVGGLGLGAANMFADAAATTTLASESGDALASGMANSNAAAGGAAPYGVGTEAVYSNPANLTPTAGGVDASQLVNMPSVGSFQSPAITPAFGDATAAAGGAAPYGTAIESNYANPGLINSAIDSNAAGQVANISPTVENPVAQLSSNEMINGQTPDSTFQQVFDQADKDVSQTIANNGTGQQYAEANKPITDSPVQSSSTPQQLPGSDTAGITPVRELSMQDVISGKQYGQESMRRLGLVSDIQPEGLTPASQEWTNAMYGKSVGGNGQESGWLDKIEGIAKGIEKYKTTANIGGNLISGAMRYAVPSQTDQAAIDLYNAKANLANQEASAIAALEERKRRQNEAVKNIKPIQLNNASNPIFGNALNGAGIINSARA